MIGSEVAEIFVRETCPPRDRFSFSHGCGGPFQILPQSWRTVPFPPTVTPDCSVSSHRHVGPFRFFPRSRQTVPVLPRVPENHSNISDIRKRSVPFSPILASDRSSSSPGRSQPGRSFLQFNHGGSFEVFHRISEEDAESNCIRTRKTASEPNQNSIRTASETASE